MMKTKTLLQIALTLGLFMSMVPSQVSASEVQQSAKETFFKNSPDDPLPFFLLERLRKEMIEKEAPSFSLVNIKGDTVRLEDYRGKILILDFWATWCYPCLVSFPGMQAAVDLYADDPEVEFLFINTLENVDDYAELVEKFMEHEGYRFHVAFDKMKDPDHATVYAYGVEGLPTKVFIDPQGMIRFQSAGANPVVREMVDEIKAKVQLIREVNNKN